MRTFLLINFFILIFNNCYSQYEDESYDDITSEKTYFTIGYLNTHMDFPSRFNNKTESQNGFLVGSRFNRRTLEDIDIGKFAKARFNIGGEFSLGITFGSDSLNLPSDQNTGTQESIKKYRVKTITGVADLFTFNFNFEYFIILPGKRAIELSIALACLNVGGTITYFDAEGSKMDKQVAYTLNFLPLYIEPSAKIRFRGATLGIGLLLNPYSFLEYRGGPKGYYTSDEEGIKGNNALSKKYAINIYMNF